MPVTQCINGHYFDTAKYSTCPHCDGAGEQPSAQHEDSKTVAMYGTDIFPGEIFHTGISGNDRENKTVAFYQSEMKADPVVGWLVSLDGPERGRDYRLHAGRNFIGRSLKMDIMLTDDDGVTRENHCSVVYDKEGNTFSLVPGNGTNTYINDSLLAEPVPISDDDVVRLGTTTLVFNAFCKGERKWL